MCGRPLRQVFSGRLDIGVLAAARGYRRLLGQVGRVEKRVFVKPSRKKT